MLIYLSVIILGLGVILAIYVYGKWKYSYYKGTGIKYVEPPVVLLGSAIKVMSGMEHMSQFVKKIYDSFPEERYVGIFESKTPLIFLRDLEIIKQIGIKNFDSFHNHGTFGDPNVDPFIKRNLTALQDDEWREMRAIMSPAFTNTKMKSMFVFVEECAMQMVNYCNTKIQQHERGILEVEVKDFFIRYTNDSIATTAYGYKINSFEDDEGIFYKMGQKATNFTGVQMLKAIGFGVIPRIMKRLRFAFVNTMVTEFFRNLVSDTMKIREKENIVRPDLIHLLMEAKKGSLIHDFHTEDQNVNEHVTVEEPVIGEKKTRTKWSDDDLAAQAFIFFIGGYDTTSTLLTFFFYEIVRNPEIQIKLQEEFDNFKRENGDKLTFNNLHELKYLDNTISETLRMWPPSSMVERVCSKSYILPPPSNSSTKSYEIKANEGVWIPIYAIHHDPNYFPNPEKFDPDRFSDENKASINPTSYIPFGIGPRICIGSRYVLIVAKIVIFHMLSNFDFVATAKTEIPVTLKNVPFNLRTKNGVWVELKRRSIVD